jgi:hypothetical protein
MSSREWGRRHLDGHLHLRPPVGFVELSATFDRGLAEEVEHALG